MRSTSSLATAIGPALRRERERRGWTREALAVHSGMSFAAIAQIESGRRTDVRLASLTALADALEVTVDHLLGRSTQPVPALEHRALLYSGADQFLAGGAAFIADGLARGEPVLVVTTPVNTRALRSTLGREARSASFADSEQWYDTPLETLNRYRDHIDETLGGGSAPVRILGEPIWRGRSRAEKAAWIRYEALINVILAARPATILCAYAVESLPRAVLAGVRRTHPEIQAGGEVGPCAEFGGAEAVLLDAAES